MRSTPKKRFCSFISILALAVVLVVPSAIAASSSSDDQPLAPASLDSQETGKAPQTVSTDTAAPASNESALPLTEPSQDEEAPVAAAQPAAHEQVSAESEGTTGLGTGWLNVPSLHPLLVHFPIVLLIIGPIFILAGMIFFSEGTQDAGIVLSVLGFVTALVVSQIVHPQVTDLPAEAQTLLDWHDKFSDLTLLAAGTGALFGGLRWLIPPLRKGFVTLALAAFLAAAGCVVLAGYSGTQLVHNHGVGVQGHYLDSQ